jgi:aminopeptidase N
MTYWTNHAGAYWVIYDQGACALADAADHLGFAHFVATLRSYAADHWFGIATTADFKAALRNAAATLAPSWDVTAYFNKWRIGAGS